MDFTIQAEQQELMDLVRQVVDEEIRPRALAMDQDGEVPDELWTVLQQTGITALAVPEAYGGMGLDHVTLALLFEELAKGCAGIATACAANMLALLPVLIGGSEEQKQAFCHNLLQGGMAAFALTEPGAGSDAAAGTTSAVKTDSGYVLNGVKHFITNGPLANQVVVFANARKERGVRGMTAFIVDASLPGFSVGKVEDKMGIRASATSEIILENCEVADSARIGKEGRGFPLAMATLNASRPHVGAISVGIAEEALQRALTYVHQREQFGSKLIALQMVQQLIADMAMQVEAARLLVYQAAAKTDAQEKNAGVYAAMAKCFASDVAMKATVDAIQVMGGMGYSRESGVEKLARDAKVMQIFEGSNQVQRGIIANGIK